MTGMTSDRESRIIDAASECESDTAIARVAAGVLELLAQRGRTAWEALARQLTQSASEEEITLQLNGMLSDLEEGLYEDDDDAEGVDERLQPDDGEIETGEEIESLDED